MKNPARNAAGSRSVLLVLALIAIASLIGSISEGCGTRKQAPKQEQKGGLWTCSMHPQIRRPSPGKCPICGMDLIPVTTGGAEEPPGERQVRLSPHAEKLADIQVAPVERKFVSADIRMVGKVDFDETRLGSITARVPGRLDRLYVDYTGIPVKKGDHMVSLYSPELLAAQQELIEVLKAAQTSTSDETARLTVEASRAKLRLWGLTDEQIKEIETRGKPSEHVTIYAPMSGIVIRKDALEGMYVETGTPIYTIADLSKVWVKLDAYETDLPWVRYGQQVDIRTEAYPDKTFKGTIAFIDPVLNAMTRTVKVRVNVPNPDAKLKPEMFVHAVVRPKLALGGKVVDVALAGKWMCPMHPEVVKDDGGSCDICGMPLVRAESLGFVAADAAEAVAPLVIPDSAPLITGKRAVVYVKVPEKPGLYEGREVTLGPRAGDYYLVSEGLAEGELVVVNGNYKIDADLQIRAKKSMMSHGGGVAVTGHAGHGMAPTSPPESVPTEGAAKVEVPDAFKAQMDKVFSAYFSAQQALSRDDLKAAQDGSKELLAVLDAVDMGLLKEPAHSQWMKEQATLKKTATAIASAADIEAARSSFAVLSDSLAAVGRAFGTSGKEPVLRFHCPMAFNERGADWLQNKAEVQNPYFGQAMLKCGEQKEVIVAGPAGGNPAEHRHE